MGAGIEGYEVPPLLCVTSTTSVGAALSSLRLLGSVSPHKGAPHSCGLLILTSLSPPPAPPCTFAGLIHLSFVLLNLRVRISPYKSLFFLPPKDPAQPCAHKCSTNILPLMKRVKNSSRSTLPYKAQDEAWGCVREKTHKGNSPLRRELTLTDGNLTEPNLASPKLFQLARSPQL